VHRRERLPDKGLAHGHVRLKGTGLLARIPKQSQMALAAHDNLRYQAACFRRAGPSGHVPQLAAEIPPSEALPRGALLVQEIVGETPRRAQQMDAIMRALAAIHALPVPPPQDRAPLLDESDPLAGLVAQIEAQAVHLDHPGVPRASAQRLRARLQGLAPRIAPGVAGCPKRLITFDAHPGNFLITPEGKAVLVDLEKLRYSHPPLDLAHASLYTSTTWDREMSFELTPKEVARACDTWAEAVGDPIAGPCRAAMVPLRELMWLWSVTWCAKWLAQSSRPPDTGGDGEDWSAQRSEAALVAHVRGRVDDYLAPRSIERVLDELAALRALLAI
jgi:aminoglycoside phosphotransferase (APT) family kinase protein